MTEAEIATNVLPGELRLCETGRPLPSLWPWQSEDHSQALRQGQRAAEQGQAEESKAPKGPAHSAEAATAQEFKWRSHGA